MLGARAYGMGGAQVALAQDVHSSWTNPAGHAYSPSLGFGLVKPLLQDVEGIDMNALAANAPIQHVGTVSGSWLVIGADLEEGNGETYRTRDYSEQTWSLGLSRVLAENLGFLKQPAVGVNLNRHVIDVGEAGNAAGTGLDLGFQTGFGPGFRLGLVASALGTDMAGAKVEPEYKMGLAWAGQGEIHGFALEVDAQTKTGVGYSSGVDALDRNWRALGGLEYSLTFGRFAMAFRGGANAWLLDELARKEYTAGAGMRWDGFQIDYAWGMSDQEISLGTVHRIGLSYRLGGGAKSEGREDRVPRAAGSKTSK
jgi:hypothetical protein